MNMNTASDISKRLRRKFILTAMGSLFLMLVLIVGTIQLLNFTQNRASADETLDLLLDNDGYFPEPPGLPDGAQPPAGDPLPALTPETPAGGIREMRRRQEAPFETRYFFVLTAPDGTPRESYLDRIAAVGQAEAESFAAAAQEKGSRRGYIETYRFLKGTTKDGSGIILFLDCGRDISGALTLLNGSLLVSAAALLLMFLLVFVFSKAAVRPVTESLEKQKRFISDAGHELKTPLAVISANNDVQEMIEGKSEWTQSTRQQVLRMTELINNLLLLTRMEEDAILGAFAPCDFSAIVSESAASSGSIAESRGITFRQSIEDGVRVRGEASSLSRLAGELLTNAMKYCGEHGEVSVSLSESREKAGAGSGSVLLEVRNTLSGPAPADPERLFERFYREDPSRRRSSGGFGLGLSAAKAICERHGGSISASCPDPQHILFQVRLPAIK